MAKTLVVISGGTIDARAYRQTPVNITPLDTSIIPQALELLGIAEQCVCYTWLRKDSKDITESDIASLAEVIQQQGYEHVVITHGTDRMAENARLMMRQSAVRGRVVIFTGAMIPIANEMEGFEKSDGYGNLKFSVEQSQQAKPGVYIGFENHLFDPARTRKDFQRKLFIED
jgi:L-asparaginase